MKIVKLEIDENSVLAGIDAVALVEQPAIEEDFMFFSKTQEFAETYTDYPKGAVEAARIGIKRNEARGNKCATQVGKVRAQQLAQRKPVSLDTVRRMRAFLIRQKGNYDLAIERKDYNACGYISYMLWGGPEALPWAEKILRRADSDEEFDFSKEQVEQVIISELIKQEMFKLQNNEVNESFAAMDEQQVVLSPLMVPNKLIKRVDEMGEEYFVYFTEDTIKKLAHKAMKDEVIHRVNIEHDGNLIDDIFMVETWLKESDNDKSTNYGYNLPNGTWFAKYKIDNKEIWNDYIKSGKVLGLSVEGVFSQLMLSKVK
tara:strand:- start:2065 stop:3009 length:945 start_codon:yes stop_codon:yes gene_type:complete